MDKPMSDTPTPDAEPTPEAGDTPAEHPWANLPLEHRALLRLPALPADAQLGPRPLCIVEWLQAERHSPLESLLRLGVRLNGGRAPVRNNLIEVWLDHSARRVVFGPAQGLVLELTGRGLGRFLLAQAIGWAKRNAAGYAVEERPLPPASGQARQLRDHWLLSQGFRVQYPEDPTQKPLFHAPSLDSLSEDWNHDKVQPLSTGDLMSLLEGAHQQALEQDAQVRRLEQRLQRAQQEDGVLRFSLTCLVTFALFQTGLLIWMSLR